MNRKRDTRTDRQGDGQKDIEMDIKTGAWTDRQGNG